MVGRLLPRVAELTSSTIAGPAGDSLAALSAWVRLVDADVSGDTLAALAVLESITVTRFAADWQAVFDFHRALQHVALGDPGTALVFTERAAAHSAVTVGPGTFSVALSCLHLLGRLDEVVERVSEMFAVPQMVAQLRIVELHSLAAMWLAWAGRPEQAATHLREAEQVGRTRNTPMTKVFLTAGRLGVALADNDEDAVALAAHLRRLCDGQHSVARLVDRGFLAVQ